MLHIVIGYSNQSTFNFTIKTSLGLNRSSTKLSKLQNSQISYALLKSTRKGFQNVLIAFDANYEEIGIFQLKITSSKFRRNIYIGVGVGVGILMIIGAVLVHQFFCKKKNTQPQSTQNPQPIAAPATPATAPSAENAHDQVFDYSI